jgi:hypothetical protein
MIKFMTVFWFSALLFACSNGEAETKLDNNVLTQQNDEVSKTAAPKKVENSKSAVPNILPALRKICPKEDNSNKDFVCYKFDIDGDNEDDTIRLARPGQFSHTSDIPDMGLDGDTSTFKLDYKQNAVIIMLSSSPQIFGINADDMKQLIILGDKNEQEFPKNFASCINAASGRTKLFAFNNVTALIVEYEPDTSSLIARRCASE